MKIFPALVFVTILLPSCLKQSIPDAMLGITKRSKVTATLSYSVNGNPVQLSVSDADYQLRNSYQLGCEKQSGFYILTGLTNTGDFNCFFYTDSLTIGNYNFNRSWGTMYFMNYNGTNGYVYNTADSLSVNVTSYRDGHISGNFSGLLTPLIDANRDVYGNSTIFITNGSFTDVPVFY